MVNLLGPTVQQLVLGLFPWLNHPAGAEQQHITAPPPAGAEQQHTTAPPHGSGPSPPRAQTPDAPQPEEEPNVDRDWANSHPLDPRLDYGDDYFVIPSGSSLIFEPFDGSGIDSDGPTSWYYEVGPFGSNPRYRWFLTFDSDFYDAPPNILSTSPSPRNPNPGDQNWVFDGPATLSLPAHCLWSSFAFPAS